MKLNIDEQDLIRDLCRHDGFKVFSKVIDDLCFSIESDVLRYNLIGTSPLEEAQKLVQLKATAQGARKLQQLIDSYKTRLAALDARSDE